MGDVMFWLAISVPLMVVAVGVATVPLAIATHHQQKYGHHGSRPRPEVATETPRTHAADWSSSWTVCPSCSALVEDHAQHESSVHATATATATANAIA
jgi:hypothetical protein